MENFQFYNPVKILFGKGEFQAVGAEVAQYGKKALLVKTVGPLEGMGIYKKARASMEASGLSVYELDGVTSNPKLSKIEEGVIFCKENRVDVVVAVGGGSGIDTAKAIAFGAKSDGDLWDYFAGKRKITATLPVIAVSTISATGAEMSCHCVVTNDRESDTKQWKKWAVHDPYVFPKTAILDPQLLISVPTRLTAAGMCDVISHVLEGYFDGVPDNPLSDRIGEGIVMTVLENDNVLCDSGNVAARAHLSWAATLAMNGLQDCGRSNAGFPAHWIQHAVGALTDSPHGEGLSVLQPAWLYHCNAKCPVKFVQFAHRVFALDRPAGMSDEAYGRAGIDALKKRFCGWGLPSTLPELGVREEMFPVLVDSILQNNESYIFTEADLYKVLQSCMA